MLFKYDPETFRLLLAALQSNDYQLVNKRFNDMYLSFSVSVNKYIRKVYKKYQQAEIPEPVYDYNWSAEKGRDHYYTQIAQWPDMAVNFIESRLGLMEKKIDMDSVGFAW